MFKYHKKLILFATEIHTLHDLCICAICTARHSQFAYGAHTHRMCGLLYVQVIANRVLANTQIDNVPANKLCPIFFPLLVIGIDNNISYRYFSISFIVIKCVLAHVKSMLELLLVGCGCSSTGRNFVQI